MRATPTPKEPTMGERWTTLQQSVDALTVEQHRLFASLEEQESMTTWNTSVTVRLLWVVIFVLGIPLWKLAFWG